MRYSLEEIYGSCGRDNYTAVVEFFPNTECYKLYGKYLVGVFVYTLDERREFEKSIAFGPVPRTHGIVKFEDLLKKIDSDLRTNLLNVGLPTSEIMRLTYYLSEDRYSFASRETKKLPNPIKVDVDFSDTDVDSFTVSMYEKKIDSGYQLCPFEKLQYLALLLERRSDKMSRDDFNRLFVDPETGDIHSAVFFYYLRNRLFKGTIKDYEKSRLQRMYSYRTKLRVEVLRKELHKATEKFKELGISHGEAIKNIIKVSAGFEDMNLTNTKFPIWLDYERFIHIFMRHVAETQVGDRFVDKTSFQYDYTSVIRLIKAVLASVGDEISEHFLTEEKKTFKRHGKKAVYYQGDYFVIDIDANGRLMTFYPLSK